MKLNPDKIRQELSAKKLLSLKSLIERDIKVNHPGEKITLDQAAQMLNLFVENGSEIIRFGNTLFIVTNPNEDNIIFHTVNAYAPQTYFYNGLQFFYELSSRGKKQATSYFSSPKMTELLQKIKLPNQTITESDDPTSGDTMIVTDLTRSA
jgi:hypothetical protein